MPGLRDILYIVAGLCFAIAACGWPPAKYSLGWLGLMFWLLAEKAP